MKIGTRVHKTLETLKNTDDYISRKDISTLVYGNNPSVSTMNKMSANIRALKNSGYVIKRRFKSNQVYYRYVTTPPVKPRARKMTSVQLPKKITTDRCYFTLKAELPADMPLNKALNLIDEIKAKFKGIKINAELKKE